MSMKRRTAFITGGGAGIGEATAYRLAREGARVGIMSRTREDLEKVASRIEDEGGEGLVLPGDVSQEEDLKQAYKKIEDQWGGLDFIFANAGINGLWAPIDDLEMSDWDKTLSINLRGTFATIKFGLPLLRKRGGGSIVVTSSVNGNRMFSNTGASAYATSKAGQTALAKMLALELADEHIRVNVICPGAIETEIGENTEHENLEHVRPPVKFPEGKVPLTEGTPGTAEEVAELVYFLMSDASRHISGTEVYIDGTQSLFQG